VNLQVVSNTSPLIFLSKLDAFDLLNCFSEVSIPGAVLSECKGLSLPNVVEVVELGSADKATALSRFGSLHQGELEAVQLALLKNVDYILMDDAKARAFAKNRGIRPMGTIGILLLANKQGLLARDLGLSYLDDLKLKHGLYISEPLLVQIKKAFI